MSTFTLETELVSNIPIDSYDPLVRCHYHYDAVLQGLEDIQSSQLSQEF